jgi:NADH-quinone oxidoreductase subunit A
VLNEYGYIAILLAFAVLFPSLPLMVSFVFRKLNIRPEAPDPVKMDTYECGVETEGDSWIQFNFRYYLVALLFVVFDVEAIFLYAWAVAYDGDILVPSFAAVMLFLAILVLGFVYDWRKGGLEWR